MAGDGLIAAYLTELRHSLARLRDADEIVAEAEDHLLEAADRFSEGGTRHEAEAEAVARCVGGEKPLGTGVAMQKFFARLTRVDAPKSIEHDWRRMLQLLVRAGERLEDAERLHTPFQICFRE